MLEHLNHPFLCNLRYSFQDIEYLYVSVLGSRIATITLTQTGTLSWT